MATSKEYLNFITEQFSELDGIMLRPMMGEYLLYFCGKLVGGLYDNRLLVKPTLSAKVLMPDAELQSPYDGAKPMLLVNDVENRDFLRELLNAIYGELPEPKPKRGRV